MSGHLEPIRLPANQPPQFYRGGDAIAALRGASAESDYGPEDWVGSATTMFGQETNGLTKLPSGVWLRDAVRENPSAWLGAKHVEALGDSTGLLVKLLDAGQRLPVHFHPSDSFAKRHFDSHFGKTEAWIVVGTYGDDPRVYPGFKETVDKATVNEWARTRDFLANPEKAHLGIGFETAIETLDTSGWDEERLGSIVKRTAADDASTVDLLADGSDAFFRADQLRPAVSGRSTTLSLDPSFAVLVVMAGSGTLRTEHGGEYALRKGETYVVPHDAGQSTVEGEVTVIRCRPPAPEKRERS